MDFKICVLALFLFTVCYGQDSRTSNQEPTSEYPSIFMDMKQTANTTLFHLSVNASNTNVYHYDDFDNYEYKTSSRGVAIGVPIVSLLLVVCCIYFCCRCRTQRNQGVVMTRHPPPPQPLPPTQIIIQQHHASPVPQPMTGVPPTYPPQQHVPPPYDTQPMWNPPPQQQQFHQQQFNQQLPTSYDNPNYGPPPLNPKY